MKKHNGLLGFLVFCTFALPLFASAALPPGFEIQTLASGLTLPTSIAFTLDGRIFIAEKDGTVAVFKNGALLPTPVIHLTDVNNYGDRGLIGIAVDPNFAQNGYLYLSYTYENTPGTNFAGPKTGRIVRVTVVGDTASESTKVVLVGTVGGDVIKPSCRNFATTSDCIPSDNSSHSVGGLRFGPDGKLYATLGDGSSFDYVDSNALRAQNIDSLAGKMLRINKDGTAPADNPFYNGNLNANRSKVYAYGLRNMYRFNFKPTGELFGGDVGWDTWEEINKIVRGGNYGWPCREGMLPTAGYNCTATNAINPFYYYAHNTSGAGAVTSGAFPGGSAYPAQYANTFFFGDYAQNWIKEMSISATGTFLGVSDFAGGADKTNGPVEFVTGPEGNIYFIAIYKGELKRITHTAGNRQPIVELSANLTSGLAPLSVSFSSLGTNDPDLDPITYLWNFGDGSSSANANPTHVYTANGSYTAVLTVRDNRGGLQSKSISIAVGNRAPHALITSPIAGSFYVSGDTLMLSGAGNDDEDGALSDSSLSWRVILHHNTHIHILETHTGNNIPFTAPDHSDPSVYTEVELTVTDKGGLTNTTSVNIYLNNGGGQGSNLIGNPSFEEIDPLNSAQPKGWGMDWWGNLNPIFTYPVAGYEGGTSRAAKLEITQYTAGDAKWIFSPAFVEADTLYTFSDFYKSNVETAAVVEIAYTSGAKEYSDLGTIPASSVWKKFTGTFTTPVGVRNISVLHYLDRVGTLTVDNFSLIKGTGTSTADTTNPSASITAPASGTTLSGIANITATAIDNIGVAGVQFLLDGTAVGAEDTTAPYSLSIDTRLYTNGAHTLSARARDAAGNIGTAPAVNVTVSNATSTGTNLIKNPSFETANGATPLGWTQDAWGVNTTTFTYPVAGHTGARAAQVKVNTYTDGDTKWFPDDVAVTSGATYTYSDWYKADDISDIIGRYTMSDGSVQYFGVAKELVPTTVWKQAIGTFVTPVGVSSVTFFHLVSSLATLTIDDASLVLGGSGNPDVEHPDVNITSPLGGTTLSGTTNITATAIDNIGVAGVQFLLDGTAVGAEDTTAPYSSSIDTRSYANGAHTLSARARDAAGNIGTAPAVNVTVSNATSTGVNLITNPSLENIDGSGNPLSWFTDIWDQNNAVFTYPVAGVGGGKAAKVTISNYVSGDAKWYFAPRPITGGAKYLLSDFYLSDSTTHVIVQFTLSTGAFSYEEIAAPAPAVVWTKWSGQITAPTNATAISVFHVLSSTGSLSIDEYSLSPA